MRVVVHVGVDTIDCSVPPTAAPLPTQRHIRIAGTPQTIVPDPEQVLACLQLMSCASTSEGEAQLISCKLVPAQSPALSTAAHTCPPPQRWGKDVHALV